MNLPALIKDMDFATYLADPAPEPSVTSSIAKQLNATAPWKVWLNTPRLNPDARAQHSDKFDLGTAAHALFVGGGDPLYEVCENDWRKKAAQEERAHARESGQTPILSKDLRRVEAMARAAQDGFRSTEIEAPLEDVDNLIREGTVIAKYQGVTCRCRPDFMHWREGSGEAPILAHFKTTAQTVNQQSLARLAAQMGWHLIWAHYGRGVKALCGIEPIQYWAVQEVRPPYLTIVAQLDSAFEEFGKIAHTRAIEIWGECLKAGVWPGHPKQTVTLEGPAWLAYDLPEPDEDDLGGL